MRSMLEIELLIISTNIKIPVYVGLQNILPVNQPPVYIVQIRPHHCP